MKHNKPIEIFIPKVPSFGNYKKYLRKMDKSRVYSNSGPIVLEFEERIANYFSVDGWQVASCANATLGLEGAISACKATGLSFEQDWSLPSWTFSATAAAVLRTNVPGTFLDVDDNWRLEVPNENSDVIDVLPFGDEIKMDRFTNHRGAIIIDAAASFDALNNFKINSYERPLGLVISFHATKSLPGGEGGLFLTNNQEWASSFRAWTKFGMKYGRDSVITGTNAKMSEISACLIMASLDQWDKERLHWLELNKTATSLARKYELKCHPALEKNFVTPYWIIDLKDKLKKENLESVLNIHNISSRNWWMNGCHNMNAYKNFKRYSMQKTEKLASETLGLPFHKYLSDRDFRRIDHALDMALSQ